MVQEGCPFVPPPACAARRRLERAEHEPVLGRRRHAGPAARGEPRRDARRVPHRDGLPTARSTSRSSTGATTSSVQLNMHNAHQSFAARQRHAELRRRRLEPGDLVHRRASRAVRRPTRRRWRSQVMDQWIGTSRRTRTRRRREQAGGRGRRVLRDERHADRKRRRRLERDPRRKPRGRLHAGVPDLLDVAHRRRRAVRGRRLQVRAAARRRTRSPAASTGRGTRARRSSHG